jgi:hypothetical protein
MALVRPAWWCYPLECANGHEWGPGRIIVSWQPCDCGPAARRAGVRRAAMRYVALSDGTSTGGVVIAAGAYGELPGACPGRERQPARGASASRMRVLLVSWTCNAPRDGATRWNARMGTRGDRAGSSSPGCRATAHRPRRPGSGGPGTWWSTAGLRTAPRPGICRGTSRRVSRSLGPRRRTSRSTRPGTARRVQPPTAGRCASASPTGAGRTDPCRGIYQRFIPALQGHKGPGRGWRWLAPTGSRGCSLERPGGPHQFGGKHGAGRVLIAARSPLCEHAPRRLHLGPR